MELVAPLQRLRVAELWRAIGRASSFGLCELGVEQGQHGLARTAPGLRLQQAFGQNGYGLRASARRCTRVDVLVGRLNG